MHWNNLVIVITGASQGIGRAAAKALAARGAKIGLVARSESALLETLQEIHHQGTIYVADVCQPDALKQAFHHIEHQLGPIDILINCAGIGALGHFNETDISTFEQLMQVNFFGTLYAMKAILPSMLARGQGHIINIASIAGRIAAPLESAYSASKFAVIGLSEAIAMEVANQGVSVSIVNPGPVDTNFFLNRKKPYALKSPRPISPEQVANKIIVTIKHQPFEQFAPKWLRWAYTIRVMLPALYKKGLRYAYRRLL